MDKTKRIGEERIGKLLWSFSIPAILSTLVSAVYNVIDRIFIGHSVGSLGIAGITVGFPIMMIQAALGMMIGIGAAALLSIKLGQQNKKEAEQIIGNSIILLSGISITVTMIIFFLDPLLIFFGASKEVLPYAREYMRVIVLGSAFFNFGMGFNDFVRAEGKPNTAMAMLLTGTILNLIFAPIFIFVFKWGMTGAGLATVTAQAITTVWVMLYYITGRSAVKITRDGLKINRHVMGQIVALGFSSLARSVAQSAIIVLMNKSLLYYGGNIAISGFGVIFSLSTLVYMPMFGLNTGSQPIIGFNYGAGSFDRVKQTLTYTILSATILAVLGFLIGILFPVQLISLFNARDAELIAFGTRAMRILILSLPLVGFQILSAGYFQAVGKPVQAIILGLSRQVLLLIPALLILPIFFKLDGVLWAMPVSDILSVIITGVFFFLDIRYENKRPPEERFADRKIKPGPIGMKEISDLEFESKA